MLGFRSDTSDQEKAVTKRLAVLISGTGTLREAMTEAGLPIALVLADRPCPGLTKAKAADLETALVPRTFTADFDRRLFTQGVINILKAWDIGLVAMAGFMTVFDPLMFEPDAFQGRIINSHPSLLPAFKGARAVRDAFEAGAEWSGTTIHYATAELDAGPIIAQEAVDRMPGDTVESWHERIKVVERRLYPAVLAELMEH